MKIHTVAGERAVHISMSYDAAERLLKAFKTKDQAERREVDRSLAVIAQARKAGRPKPPLPYQAKAARTAGGDE